MAVDDEKLIKWFAVEPASLTCWNDFRYVFEKFGFSEGRLLVKFPSPDWPQRVLASCKSDFERKQIEEKLIKSARSAFIEPPSLGHTYNDTWLQGAKNIHLRRSLEGIVVKTDIPESLRFTKTSTVSHCSEEFFGDAGQTVVAREAKSLASASAELMALSSRIVIVDQYFSSRPQFTRSLTEFLRLACENGCEYIDVLTKDGVCDNEDLRLLRENRDQIFQGCRQPMHLSVKVLRPKTAAANFHHRFVLSEVGGIRYDAGVDAVDAEAENDVAVLNRSFHAKQVVRYLGELEEFVSVCSAVLPWDASDVARSRRAAARVRR